MVVVQEDLLSQTDLVGLLRKVTHDENKANDGPHQSTDV